MTNRSFLEKLPDEKLGAFLNGIVQIGMCPLCMDYGRSASSCDAMDCADGMSEFLSERCDESLIRGVIWCGEEGECKLPEWAKGDDD